MAKFKGAIVINIERCKGCEVCTTACPEEVIGMNPGVNSKGYHYAMMVNDRCVGCANCAVVCPDGVITVYRTKITTEV
ncbi:MAG TPA: 4Fe-4S dicluster domain-containing protein [Bacteroidales bacterium]|nr:4Fe-4S dicluster domain-containing protein [Bacteroidales bacterium]